MQGPRSKQERVTASRQLGAKPDSATNASSILAGADNHRRDWHRLLCMETDHYDKVASAVSASNSVGTQRRGDSHASGVRKVRRDHLS